MKIYDANKATWTYVFYCWKLVFKVTVLMVMFVKVLK